MGAAVPHFITLDLSPHDWDALPTLATVSPPHTALFSPPQIPSGDDGGKLCLLSEAGEIINHPISRNNFRIMDIEQQQSGMNTQGDDSNGIDHLRLRKCRSHQACSIPMNRRNPRIHELYDQRERPMHKCVQLILPRYDANQENGR